MGYFLGIWSGWRDLNSRPRRPERRALPTALHPVILFSRSILSQMTELIFGISILFQFNFIILLCILNIW